MFKMAAYHKDGITIGTISGGIVNFGGAVTIAPISITNTTSGSSNGDSGTTSTSRKRTDTNSTVSDGDLFSETSLSGLLEMIRRSFS
ncbi:hypothetical protein [Bacillus sp. USDA818B3_A]|uniref:hypothetical protein n=1 Tax=Bacillus sp. USDA818B3_A TaxID=2698834 RepID=UPI00136A8487|nr:hypothetical protein [Bacillus sp. USDA818B3_A]